MDHYLQAGMIVLLISLWWSTARLDGSVRTTERNLSAILRHLNIDPTAVVPPSNRVKQLAADPKRRIEAMRVYRQETGADVRVAKATVDGLIKER